MKTKFFRIAKKESLLSDYNGEHIGCVAVYGGKVLAKAHNSYKTNTTQYFFNSYRIEEKSNIMECPPKSHAETNLYRKIKFLDIDFKKVTVYIYREFSNGQPAPAKCCKSCEQLLRKLGIRDIAYTTNGGYIFERFVEN